MVNGKKEITLQILFSGKLVGKNIKLGAEGYMGTIGVLSGEEGAKK